MASKHIFTQMEKKVFLDVLKSHAKIIENKNTDSFTLRKKNVAWGIIAREYNASPYVTAEFSIKQLRRLWMNLKQRQREAITKERQHRMATGGGPSTSRAVIDSDVVQIAPSLMLEIPGAINSDTVFGDASMDLQPKLNLDITQQPSTGTNTQSTSSTSTASFQRHKNSILEKEYRDRFNRAGEIHYLEKELLEYKIREAKAKAELAELILERERSQEGTN